MVKDFPSIKMGKLWLIAKYVEEQAIKANVHHWEKCNDDRCVNLKKIGILLRIHSVIKSSRVGQRQNIMINIYEFIYVTRKVSMLRNKDICFLWK